MSLTDFTGDGKLDLVASLVSPVRTGELYLIPGDGTGNFGHPTLIYMPPANNFVGSYIAAGDFDGDGRADVAFLDDYNCDKGNCFSALHVLYNGGNSQFTDTTDLSSLANDLNFSAGDLNSDGRTDIFGFTTADNDPPNQLEVLYGQANRTFHTYTPAVPSLAAGLALADFNGDTRMDLVGIPTAAVPGDEILFLLADSAEGSFTPQVQGLPATGSGGAPIVGDFNVDSRPDVYSGGRHDYLHGHRRSSQYNRIGQLGRLCLSELWHRNPRLHARQFGGFTRHIRASANSFGQLRKIELFVDGTKVAEQFHAWGPRAWFNFSGTLSPGPHRGVMIAADIDNRLQQTVFNFTVGSASCSAPTSAGVHICAPASGATVTSPVQVQAMAKVTGTLSSTQLWVDGVKKFSTASNSLNTSVVVASGTHRFAVLAINATGQKWESVVNATVK